MNNLNPRTKYTSNFHTTYKNQLLDWASHTVIFPVYVVCIYSIWQFIFYLENLYSSSELLFNLKIPISNFVISYTDKNVFIHSGSTLFVLLFFVFALTPIFLTFFARPYWSRGLAERGKIVIVCLLALMYFLVLSPSQNSQTILSIIQVVISLTFALGLIQYLLSTRFMKVGIVALIFVLLSTFTFFVFVEKSYTPLLEIVQFVKLITNIVPLFVAGYIIAIFLIEFLATILRFRPQYLKRYLEEVLIITLYLFFLITLNKFEIIIYNYAIIALITLATILIIAHPRKLLSYQRACYRQLLATIRIDSLLSDTSATLPVTSVFNRVRLQFSKIFTVDNQWIGVMLSFLVGGVLIPAFEFFRQQTNYPLINLLVLGSGSAISLVSFYLVIWFIRQRQRYIIEPFSFSGDDDNNLNPELRQELQRLTTITTHSLIQQIHQIGLLLNLRQVENNENDSALAFFVTSGQEPSFLQDVNSLTQLEEINANAKIFTNLISTIVRTLAVVRVRGTIHRRKDGTLQFWVEFARRRHETIAVDLTDLPSTESNELDEFALARIARKLAIKLILRLGYASHLASSVESLDYFLRGLQASSERNWWVAIDAYRSAIQLEEAERGQFAIGYYHLGVALILQGELDDGVKALQQSENSSAPLPETSYMLALTKLYEHWDDIHHQTSVFKEIERRCRHARRLRPRFAETYHLMGAAHYQRGKLIQRQQENFYSVKNETSTLLSYQHEYQQAEYYFRKSLKEYERAYWALPNVNLISNTLDFEIQRLIQERLTVMHRLADSLRSQGHHAEADSYYLDVLEVLPTNTRTLIDVAKNYCLMGNWQRAEEFLERQVMTVPEAAWHSDANIYMGWAKAGGVADIASALRPLLLIQPFLRREEHRTHIKLLDAIRFIFIFSILSFIICFVLFFSKFDPLVTTGQPFLLIMSGIIFSVFLTRGIYNPSIVEKIFAESFTYLDFALHQRPQYMTRWSQTNWLDEFLEARYWLRRLRFINSYQLENIYDAEINPKQNNSVLRYAWLFWRLNSRNYFDSSIKDFEPRGATDENILKDIQKYPNKKLASNYRELQHQREAFGAILQKIDESGRLYGMSNARLKLESAAIALDNWKDCHKKIKVDKDQEITFSNRWCIDVYAEISLFAIRLLSEGKTYECAWYVANDAICKLEEWLQYWNEKFHESNQNRHFTHRTFRFQLASLYAWRAYNLIALRDDITTRARMKKETTNDKYKKILDDPVENTLVHLQDDVNKAIQYIPRHPLAMLVQSDIYHLQQQQELAIEELQRLLSVVSPFDPNAQVGNWEIHKKRHPKSNQGNSNDKKLPLDQQIKKNLRQRMRDQELVCGQRQFDLVVNPSEVHTKLAKLNIELQRINAGVKHLSLAVSFSPYWDVDAENLLSMAQLLDRLDRYTDASAVLKALRIRRYQLDADTLSRTKLYYPDILNCVIETRMRHYSKSLSEAELLIKQMKFLNLGNEKDKGKSQYYSRLPQTSNEFGGDNSSEGVTGNANFETLYESTIDKLIKIKDVARDNSLNILPKLDEGVTPELIKLISIYFSVEARSKISNIETYKFTLIKCYIINNNNAKNDQDSPIFSINDVLAGRLLHFVTEEALRSLEQTSMLSNNIAYNQIELKIFKNINNLTNYPQNALRWIQQSIGITQLLYNLANENNSIEFIEKYKQELAYYYDTLGWYYYRSIRFDKKLRWQESLDKCIKNLEIAQSYNQNSAIIYYHLTRSYITLLERKWEDFGDTYSKPQTTNEKETITATEIDTYLVKALDYWRQASQLDKNHRLIGRLANLGERIRIYRETWNKRHLRKFGGN